MSVPWTRVNWIYSRVYFAKRVSVVIVLYTIFYVLLKEKITTAIISNVIPYRKIRGNNEEHYLNLRKLSYIIAHTKPANLSIERLNDTFDKYLNSQTDTLFFQVSGSLETTVECVGPLYNQSCLYKNLYYVNSTFLVLMVKGRNLPNLTVRADWMPPWDLSPSKREFDSYAQLDSFVREVIDPTVIPNLTVYFHQLWSFNIGHALFDGLYPAYISVIRFAPRHLYPFRLLVSFHGCKDCWTTSVCSRFADLDIFDLKVLKNMSTRSWFVFDSLIMGSGNMCQRCLTQNLQLPGGIELDGARLFRDRMYEKHGVPSPVTRQQNSAENRNSQDLLIAYVIDNKRFTDNDRKEINAAIREINNYTDMYLNKTIDSTTKIQRPLIRISFLDYNHVIGRKSSSLLLNIFRRDSKPATYKLTENKFEAQLQILRTMDIHVTGPGTGQMNQAFLPDGSVTINLGGVAVTKQGNKTIKYTLFMEQHVTAGIPYIKGLYYPINERTKGIKKNHVVKLIEKAAHLIINKFSIPVVARDNLARDGQLFTEMCGKDKDFCASFTERTIGREVSCMDSWVERFVHEDHVWSVGGVNEYGRNISCPFNRTLLHELRIKYDINH